MAAMVCGLGVRNTFADDPEEVAVTAQRPDGNRGEFEVAIKKLTAHLKELKQEAAELKKANKPDRFDLAKKKLRETVEKLETLKSRFRKFQDKAKPRREVRRRKEVRRVREKRRERDTRRERARSQRTELDGAIEETKAEYFELKKKAQNLARTDKKDAQEEVRRELRKVGGTLERLIGERNRRLAARRKGEGRERGERRERRRPRREEERREEERRGKDRGPQTELNNAIERLTDQHNELKEQAEELARTDNRDAQERVRRELREVGGELERLHGQRNRQRAERGERRERGEENPEIRAAVNRLEHIHAAIDHLKEAGLTELAQAAGERAEQLQAVIIRSRKAMAERRERGEREGREEKDEDSDRDGNDAMREIGQAVRQLNKQLKELREDVNNLKEKLGDRK